MKKQSQITLITVPNPFLLEATSPVASFDNALNLQVQSMRDFLKTQEGAGLAANQIGLNNSVVIVELDDKENFIPFQVFINPKIVEASDEKDILEEGCLSVPQIELPVERAQKIKIRFQNTQGKKVRLTAKSILARILQHEIDHLEGIIFTQRIKEKFLNDNPEFKNLKIIFCGSGRFAATILEGLILLGLKLEIITEKGKPAGRDQKIKPTPVAEKAQKFNKKFLEIENISELSSSSFDLLICADFGKIITKDILKKAKISAINIHPSLLPKYRGATPIQTAILEGENQTGVTIIKMSPEIDQGDILAQVKTSISPNDNGLTLSCRLATLALKLLFEALPNIAKDNLQALKQDEKKAIKTRKFQKADGEIDWKNPILKIERQIRAFYPWPGSYTFLPDGKRLIIHQAHLENSKSKAQNSKLILDIVQLEGGIPIKWSDFQKGYRGQKPDWFLKIKQV